MEKSKKHQRYWLGYFSIKRQRHSKNMKTGGKVTWAPEENNNGTIGTRYKYFVKTTQKNATFVFAEHLPAEGLLLCPSLSQHGLEPEILVTQTGHTRLCTSRQPLYG